MHEADQKPWQSSGADGRGGVGAGAGVENGEQQQPQLKVLRIDGPPRLPERGGGGEVVERVGEGGEEGGALQDRRAVGEPRDLRAGIGWVGQ